uniref:Lipid-binding serum glycoprotein C-terminal domain-containing protein n=1 Tax=Electrophorus electricus TaxID=8005 RepID=A0A4W4GE12_ELEEL
MSSIPSSQLLTLSQNPTFVNNILKAPEVLQEKFVQKIISIDETEAVVNVPNELATYIPRVLLASLNTVKISVVNQKNWNQGQAVVLFGPVASATSNLILQGFTSTSAQALPVQKVIQLVHACRLRPGRSKVPLQESQLTSMYTYVKNDTSLTFSDVPPDMLLYYDYEMVQKVNCSLYFSALGRADFSVSSSFLNRQKILFNNAQTCLGISGFNLNKTQVAILGNMTCTLNSSYIQNSDPLIIEKLKNCGDLTDFQVSGIQTLLFSGNTNYGNLSTWNLQTLQQLGPLPLYLNQDFWNKFNFTEKKIFLPSFMSALRAKNTPVTKLQSLFTASKQNFRRRRDTGCTAGYITDTTIADQSFILNYTSTQFDLCLNITVLINNLAAITQIVLDPSMEMVILNKLNQVYLSGLGDSVLQLLGPTSRVANVSEIKSWNITSLDTLASLMNPVNGAWTSDQSNAVIMNYLRVPGHTLGLAEINAIMSDICSLNTSALNNITAENLRYANPIDLSNCTIDQKTALYNIANISFSSLHSNATEFFLLIRSFLGKHTYIHKFLYTAILTHSNKTSIRPA